MKQPTSHITQSGNRNVNINGDVKDSVIITGDGNTIYFSPQRTLQMRAPVSDFVGRENEINKLVNAIKNGSGAAICGIKGMGGVGKTELALKVAHELKKDFPAQLRVDLQGTSDHPTSPETALGFVIRAFYKDEIKLPDSLPELISRYWQVLDDKPVLLLLDNAHRPEQVRPFLPPSNCALLITSRHPIKLPGLTHLDLETLPPDKARELFNAIKSGVAPDIADEICKLCGYLPLAIRAAATLLDVEIDLDAADYLNELRDERKRLKEIERVNDEDLSVTASFNLSYARLNKEQQHVFRNLSAFPASFDAAAAEAICEDEKHQSLSELLKRSLVNYSPDAKRYRLHDLVRLYAKDKSLKAGDDSYAAELRFANYYLILAIMFEKEFSGNHLPKKFAAMIDFDKESDNIFAGHHWSADVWEANPSAAQLCSLFGLFYIDLLSLRNTPRERILLLEASLNASHKIGFKPSEVILLNNIGLAYSDAGEIDLATDCYKEALNSVQKNSDRQQEGAILNNLGNQYLDDPQCALNYFSQAYEISKEFDDLRGKACSLGNLANANSLLGNTEHAINLYKESLEISEEMGDLKYIMNTYNQLGNVYKNTDEIEIAKRYYQKGLKISLQLKDREQEGTFRCNIGDIYYDENKYDQAMAFTKKGLQILNELESPHAETARNNLEFMRLISQT